MKYLLVVLILLFVLGCGDDNKKDEFIPQPEWWESFMSDTSGINFMLHDQVDEYNVLVCTDHGKLRICINDEYDNHVLNWIDKDYFKSTRDMGYGVTESINYKGLIIDTLNHCFIISLSISEYLDARYGTNDLFIINKNGKFIYKSLIENNIGRSYVCMDWYNNSFLVQQLISYGDIIPLFCVSSFGEVVCSYPRVDESSFSNLMPISYSEGIYIQQHEAYRLNLVENKKVWEKHDLIDLPKDCRYDFIKESEVESYWNYKVEITNIDGSKETRKFKINIETGEITEQ